MPQHTHFFVDISNTYTKCVAGSLTSFSKKSYYHPTAKLNSKWVKEISREYPSAVWWVSSVVPHCNQYFIQTIAKEKLFFLNAKCKLGIQIEYPQPQKIGADRLANAVAAAEIYGAPSIVVDFGTAVTFDLISKKRAYIGGVIAPGLRLMTNYLHEKTALLPNIELRAPKSAIGKSTVEAMRVGAFTGYCGLVKEILSALCKEMGSPKPRVIATGGDAAQLARYIPQIEKVHPRLTLLGLQLVAKLEAARVEAIPKRI